MMYVEGLSPRGPLILGTVTALVLVLGFGIWAATVPIDGAILASGEVDAAPQRYTVQHETGGVVAMIAVREGQEVFDGELLLRLEGGTLEQEWVLASTQLAMARARNMRLHAERDGVDFTPPSLNDIGSSMDPRFQSELEAQMRQFSARRDTLHRQIQQLQQRSTQVDAQIEGLMAQGHAMAVEAGLLAQDLAIQQALRDGGLTATSRVALLEREAARLDGNRAGLVARVAELHGQTAEIDLQIETLLAQRREEAENQLAENEGQLVELRSRLVVISERRTDLRLRAPVSGHVFGLGLLGPGAVLRPAESAMQIVTRTDNPVLALKVTPADIDYVFIGQEANVTFPALVDHSAAMKATVTAISAAPFVDDRTGARHYRVEARLTPEALAELDDQSLLAGLTLQAYLTTGARTPLAYLIAPVVDQMDRAMRQP